MRGEGAEFALHEIGSAYVEPEDRYIVSLIVGYEPDDETEFPTTPAEAAAAALSLTTDAQRRSTQWFVYDRKTGEGKFFEQGEFQRIHVP